MQEPEYTEHNYRKTSAVVSGAANFTEEDMRLYTDHKAGIFLDLIKDMVGWELPEFEGHERVWFHEHIPIWLI